MSKLCHARLFSQLCTLPAGHDGICVMRKPELGAPEPDRETAAEAMARKRGEPPATLADDLRLRAKVIEADVVSLRARGDAIRATTTSPWQATSIHTGRSPIELGQGYFNAAVAARRLAAELRELADMEDRING